MLVIWGRINSVNVQKVLLCCEELGIEYRRIDAGGPFGVVDTPEYRRRNPNGLVPTIDDDGFVLWESNAIVRYLAEKHRGSLWPADPHVRAVADQWMDWTNTTYWPALRTGFLGLVRTPPAERNATAIAESLRKTAEILAHGGRTPRLARLSCGRRVHGGRHRARRGHLALDGDADRAPGAARTSSDGSIRCRSARRTGRS